MANVTDLKVPGRTTASGRSSSVTNAFINAPLPYLEPSLAEKREILQRLKIDENNVCCAYCGDTATEWDHLYPTVKDRKETGFFTEMANLVPACGKCNQSKGNKDWEIWIKSDAPLSPHKRGAPNLELRIQLLREFALKFPPRKVDLSEIRKSDHWKKYEALREEIVQKLRSGDELARLISKMILESAGFQATPVEAPVISISTNGE